MAYAHTKGESIWRIRALFSVLMAGASSFPDWRMVQFARAESNSLVKRRGSGVGESSIVGVGTGVSVTGMNVGVGEAGIVAVGMGEATGVGIADWQAVRRKRHPMRSFFMALIKTQLPDALFQAITFIGHQTCCN